MVLLLLRASGLVPLILQSHYPNRRSADGLRAKFGKFGRRRPIVGRRRHRFWLMFSSADVFFCRSTQVKSFVYRSADFHGICHRWSVGRWSPDDRPTFWRNLHHVIGRRLPNHRASIRPTIARRSVDDVLSKNRRQTDADMVARLSADHKMWFVLYSLYYMYLHYVWN